MLDQPPLGGQEASTVNAVSAANGVARPKRLRTAVIGTGFVGPFHVDAVRRTGLADVVALVGSDRARTEARAASLGVDLATTDVTAVLEDPTLDVVHVCTPNRTHVELATRALQAGKHVVVEKPIAVSAADAWRMADLAVGLGRHAAVALTYRGYPMVRRARSLVAAGELGELRLVHGGYIQDWLSEATDYNWRLEPDIGGPSRAVADIGSHWFDTAEFIAGRRIAEVFADVATFIPRRMRPLGGSVAFASGEGPAEEVDVHSEDAATILVRFEEGARGACVISQVSPGRKNGLSLELAGSGAPLDWEQEEPERLWLRTREEARVLTRGLADGATAGAPGIPSLPAGHPEGWADALRDLLRPFYEAVGSGTPPFPPGVPMPYPTLSDGARGVAFVETVLASAREGRWAPIESRT